jgi:hypothetical protein
VRNGCILRCSNKAVSPATGPLMGFIDWRPAPDRNVEVVNDTADLYRYLDCTDEAEFLYACVKRTVEYDLPHENRLFAPP